MNIDLVNKTVSADEYVTEAYKEFGAYSNLHRHIPYVLDGLKPVYKKVLVTLLLKEPPGKMIKTANVTGLTIGYYSPHGDAALKDVVATLVRAGILEGQGNHGIKMLSGEEASCAAPRYTECRLAPSVREQIDKLIDYVPKFVNDLGNEEPEYIPTPLPFCLAEYTKVKLTDGRSLTMKELAEEYNSGKTNYLFSCNNEGEFRVSKLNKCWKTKSVNKLIRITLDNGEIIDSTEDHKFMLRDGSYLPASELTVDTSLMPGYMGEVNEGRYYGRRTIKNNYTGNYDLVMELSDMYNLTHGIYSKDKVKVIRHHVDKNKFNDNPNNIIRVSKKEHSEIHFSDMIKASKTPEAMEKIRKTMIERGTNERLAPEFKLRMNKPEVIAKRVERRRANGNYKLPFSNSDSEMIKKQQAGIRAAGVYERTSIRTKLMNTDPAIIRSQRRSKFRNRYYKYLSKLSPADALNKLVDSWNFSKWFDSVDEFKSFINYNHKISKIEIINLNNPLDVYDLEVDSMHHNFLLDAGVVVHNCAITSTIGIGIGTGTKVPGLSADSLIKAYRADDPSLLKPSYGMHFIKDASDLSKIWASGQGRLTYAFDTKNVPGGIEVTGNPELYQPNFTYMYQERGWGNVVIEDLSGEISKLRFTKAPRVQKMTEAFIREEVTKQCTFKDSFYVRAHYKDCVYPLGLRDWIDITYNNYANLISRYKDDNIKKSENAIKVYTHFREVADKLINTEDSRESIAQSLNIEPWIVDEIGKRSINTLRKLDPNKEIKKQEDNIEFYKKVNSDSMIDEYVKDSFQEY